jgi:hypothetical protein
MEVLLFGWLLPDRCMGALDVQQISTSFYSLSSIPCFAQRTVLLCGNRFAISQETLKQWHDANQGYLQNRLDKSNPAQPKLA